MSEDPTGNLDRWTADFQELVAGIEKPEWTFPEKRSEAEIEQLVKDLIEGRVVAMTQVPAHLTSYVFYPFFHSGIPFPFEQAVKLVVLGVEGRHAVAARTVYGYPIFLECEVWLADDYVQAGRIAQELIGFGR